MQILKSLIKRKHKISFGEMKLIKIIFVILYFLLSGFTHTQIGWAQETKAEKEFNFAQKLFEDKLYILAAEQFKDFAKNYPNNEQADNALFLCGESFSNEMDYNLAFEAFRELEISYPLSALIAKGRFQMASCQVKLNNFEAAAKLYQRIPVFHPESEFAPKAYYESGRAYLKAGKNNDGLSIFLNLINDYPDSRERLDAYREIVQLQIKMGDFSDAIDTIDGIFRALGSDLKYPQIDFLRAEIFEKLGQINEAESAYLKLLESFPSSPESKNAHYKLGVLSQNNGDYDVALKYFNNYIANADSTRQSNPVYLKRGDILLLQKQYDAALESYQKAISLSAVNHQIEAEFKTAKVLAILDKNQLAVDKFTELISKETYLEATDRQVISFVKNAYLELTAALLKIHRYRDALELIQEYSKKYASSPELAIMHIKKAEIFEKNIKDFTRALRLYDEFLETFPFRPEVDDVQLAIARCYESLTENKLALNEYQNYLTRYPAGDQVDWVLHKIRLISEIFNYDTGDGLNQLSNLIGKFANGQNNANLNLELGKVFFEQKDFTKALSYFKKELAISTNNTSKEDVYFYLGKIYFRLAERSKVLNQHHDVEAYFDSAAICLNILKDNQDSTQWAEEPHFLLAQIELDKLSSPQSRQSKLLELKIEWENRYPESKHLDFISINLANELLTVSSLQQDSSFFQQALEIYQQIHDKYPASEYFDEAQFKEPVVLSYLGTDSLALEKITDFINTTSQNKFLPEALLLKAKLERNNEDFVSAIETLNKIKSDYFYSAIVRKVQLELADIHFQMGNFQSAIDNYKTDNSFWDNLLLNDSENIDFLIYYKEAQAYENLGQYNNALAKYITLIQKDSTHAYSQKAMFAVARIAQTQNKLTLAKEYNQSILRHASKAEYKYQANISLGDIYFQQDLFQEANRRYLSAIQMAKNSDEEKYPIMQSIRCKYKLKKFTAADSDVKMFRKKFDDSKNAEGQFLIDKGNAYISEKQFELAEKTFKKLKSDFKKTDFAAKGEFSLGAIYLITNHTEEALEILTNIPTKYPDSEVTPLTYFNLGDFYYKSQQIENAISAFKQIMQHSQAKGYYQKALQYLIKCYSDLYLWDQAIVNTRMYLTKFPTAEDRFSKMVDLAKYLMYLKEYNRAIANFKQLKSFANDEMQAEIQFYIGQCYNEMGNFERAAVEYLKVKYLTKATKLPWHVTAQFEASKCLIRSGETAIARKILQRIIKEQGSENNFGRFALQKLEEIEKGENPVVEKIVK